MMGKFFTVGALTLSLALSAGMAQAAGGSLNGTNGFLATNVATSFQDLSIAPGNFVDDFTFNVNWSVLGSTVAFDLSTLTFTTPISNLAISVIQGAPGAAGNVIIAASNGTTPGLAVVSQVPLSPTNNPYFIEVTGTAVGASSFSGAISVAAVPEPESYALMLAGLGLMGIAVRRKVASAG